MYSDQYWSISNWYLARRPFWSYLVQFPEATTPKSASVQLDDQWSSLYPVSQLAWATKTGQRKSFTFLYKYLISLEYHLQGCYNWPQVLETHLQVSERLYIVLATLIIEVSLHNPVSTSYLELSTTTKKRILEVSQQESEHLYSEDPLLPLLLFQQP